MLAFKKTETPTFGGRKIVRYRTGSGPRDFEINASHSGICIAGECPILSAQAELEVLAEYIARAWKHYQAMRGENGISVEQT